MQDIFKACFPLQDIFSNKVLNKKNYNNQGNLKISHKNMIFFTGIQIFTLAKYCRCVVSLCFLHFKERFC